MRRLSLLVAILVFLSLAFPAQALDRSWTLGPTATIDLGSDLELWNAARTRVAEFLRTFDPTRLTPKSTGTISVGGIPLDFGQYGAEPVYLGDRTMVPLRAVAEAYGAVVDWNPVANVVTIRHWTNNIQLLVGDNRLFVDGYEIILDTNSFLHNGRTYVPLRAFSEFLGAAVRWDPETNDIDLTNDWKESTIVARSADGTKSVEIRIQPIEGR